MEVAGSRGRRQVVVRGTKVKTIFRADPFRCLWYQKMADTRKYRGNGECETGGGNGKR
jgi:hypothetical protein